MEMIRSLLARGEQAMNETVRRGRRAIRDEDPGTTWRNRIMTASFGAMAGAALAMLFDPARGRARRARLADQGAATVRRAGREGQRLANRVVSDVRGKMEAARHAGSDGDPFPDDVTLRDRVQTELFRDPDIPKSSLNVNVERGVVVLRGEIPDDEMRRRIVKQVEGMSGVWSVHDLMHLPGETAPTDATAALPTS